MSEMHEVSRAIGAMQASVENLSRSHADKAEKDEQFRKFVYQKLNAAETAAAETARAHARIDQVEALARGTERSVNRAKWLVTGIGLAAGGIGAKISAFFGFLPK
jgi:hypothetical protein